MKAFLESSLVARAHTPAGVTRPEVRFYLRAIALFVAVLFLVAAFTTTPKANPLLAFVFEDTGASGWGQAGTGNPPYWEWMTMYPDIVSAMGPQDLDPNNAYYACSPAMTQDWGAHEFGAVIFFANNYEDSQNQVVVELRKGNWYSEGTLLASDSTIVDNAAPAKSYHFYFGVHWGPSLSFNNESLVIKIKYFGPGGDTHIYWDTPEHWSHMYAGSTNPTQPTTWGRIKALYKM
jgi:hypothetical protein